MIYHSKKKKVKPQINKQKPRKNCYCCCTETSHVPPCSMLANVSAGEKNSSLPLSLPHLTVVSQEYMQVCLNILFTTLSVGEKKIKMETGGICMQQNYKSCLSYNWLLVLFVSALAWIWTLTSRFSLNNLNVNFWWSLLWRTIHTNPSHS